MVCPGFFFETDAICLFGGLADFEAKPIILKVFALALLATMAGNTGCGLFKGGIQN